jgi:glycosyltransferase involved in cell wall biosynthesis
MIETLTSSPSTKRILLYTDCPGIYGASQWNHSLIMKLTDLGYHVSCAQCQASHHLIEQRNQRGIEHFWLDDRNLYFPSLPTRAFSNTSEYTTIFTQAKPDLIIFSDGFPVSNIVAKKIAIEMGIPYITIIHCVTKSWAKKFVAYLHYLPEIYQHSREIFTVSQDNLNLLHQNFKLPSNVGQVIYNGIPQQYFSLPNLEVAARLRQELNISHDSVICFTAARLDLVKGYHYQMSAIQQLQQREIWHKLYFVWAGSGSLSLRFQDLADEIGISDRVKFIGERSDIPDLLDAADIFILPSQFEGMPLAIMEAMAKGKPVIATAVSGIPEELGETGKLLPDPNIYPEATIQELALTIENWATNPQLRSDIGQACKHRAEQMFKEERMLQEYITIIEKLLN